MALVLFLCSGRLTQLTGLNLASNPLVSPPPHVVEKGTRAVLKYLQEELAMTGEVDEDVAEKEGKRQIHVREKIASFSEEEAHVVFGCSCLLCLVS